MKRRKQGPNGNAKRRAPEEQQTATGKVEVVRVLAKANQNLTREMENPRPTRGSKMRGAPAPELRSEQLTVSAALLSRRLNLLRSEIGEGSELR